MRGLIKFLSVLFCSVFLMGAAAYADAEFTVTTTADTTSFKFNISAAGAFTVDWGDGNVENITKNNTANTTYSHTYSTAGAYNIGISGQATGYNPSSHGAVAAISFSSNKNVAGISGSLSAIFGTLADGTNPSFYSTFWNCTNLTGNLPTELFSGLYGAPSNDMFRVTFSNAENLTGYVNGRMFSGLTGGFSSWDHVGGSYSGTFNGTSSIDRQCPDGTYSVPAPYGAKSGWAGVAVCITCPDEYPLFDSGNTEFYKCYNTSSARCGAGKYYDATVSRCTTCPVGSYCPGEIRSYDDGTITDIVACPYGGVSSAGSASADDCAFAPKFTFSTNGHNVSWIWISAAGTFSIDWGDGSGIQTISKARTDRTRYWHQYKDYSIHTISISGRATEYNTSPDVAVIDFEPSYYMDTLPVSAIGGSLGSIFGVLPDGTQPSFYRTFAKAAITDIPSGLFSGTERAYTPDVFTETFAECRNLTSVPEGLFSGIQGAPTEYMFNGTFMHCYNLTDIPENLFSGVQGAPVAYMFNSTFSGCHNLNIPENLFRGIQGAPAAYMFSGTFVGFAGNIPENLFSGVQGAPAAYMFPYTFQGFYGTIPEKLFSGVQGAPAPDMFYGTFFNSGITSIPGGLFSGVQGAPAMRMFSETFSACFNLTSIPENLFSGVQGAPAMGMFMNTFSSCDSLTSIPENLFSGVQGAPAMGMFSNTFTSCGSLTSIPENLFSGVQGAPAMLMFPLTFADCAGLTSVPAGLFSGIDGEPADGMFYGTFDLCSNLTGYVDGSMFKVIAGSVLPPTSDEEIPGPYLDTFAGAEKMDTVCPENTYGVTKPNSDWTVAVCSVCPDGTTSPAGSTSIDACVVGTVECAPGFAFNSARACGALCGAGMTRLNTSSGLSIPIFAAQTTSPTFALSRGDAVCYVDLVAGEANGAINVDYKGAVYHTVQ